jgi:hypothetical protein
MSGDYVKQTEGRWIELSYFIEVVKREEQLVQFLAWQAHEFKSFLSDNNFIVTNHFRKRKGYG